MMSSTVSRPDRQADHVGPGAGGDLLLGAELAVRGRGGVDDERAGVADVGDVGDQLAVVDDPDAAS
jgi:hypothetical protein